MIRFLRRILVAAILAAGLTFVPFANVPAATGASECAQLRNDIQQSIDYSGYSGYSSQVVPDLCTKDCPSLYNYYLYFPEIFDHDALAARLIYLFAACNISKVPPSGLPSSGTTETPTHVTIKCPKINRDMHGRKDFAGTTCLAGKVLSGFNLSGMDLTGASLRSTNFTSANLSGAKLNRADLTKATLDYSNLQSADLSSATLKDLRASHISGSPSHLPWSWKLSKGFLFGPHVDLSRVWLKGLTLDNLDLSYANLSKTNLDGAKLSNLNINQATFTPSLKATTTRGITGRPATWSVLIVNGYLIAEGVNLSGVNLTRVNLRGKTIKGINLAGANLSYADLSSTKFISVGLKGTNFDGAKLDGANFDKADLTGASMQRASAVSTSFANAKLGRVDFSNSNLTGANLSYADIYGVRIEKTDLSKVRMDGARSSIYVSGTPKALPAGWIVLNGYLKKP